MLQLRLRFLRIPRMLRPSPAPHHRILAGAATTAILLAAPALLVGGCARSENLATNRSGVTRTTGRIDADLLVGTDPAREIGYRVDWQYPVAGHNLKLLSVQGDSVFTMDENNYLTRIDREDGTRVWRIPISYPLAEVQDVIYVPSYRRVLVLSGDDLFVLNSSDGSQIERQKLGRIANTRAILNGETIVYGARNGQVAWHAPLLGVGQRGFQVSQYIKLDPVRYDNVLVAIGNDGEIAVLDINSGAKFWRKQLLDRISAAATIGPGAVYIAGEDQHVWAFDIANGRQIWRYLSESPLMDSPVLLDDRLYQRVPAEGLMCFEALPFGKPGGVIIWTNPEISGNVITRRRENLVCWDDDNRKIEVVTANRGGHVTTVELPEVIHLLSTDLVEGEIYAAGDSGKVIRLVPRN